MPDSRDLRAWLRHNVGDLRTSPDMVTEAAGDTVRFRWHGVVILGGVHYGLGVDLRPGPTLGEVWMYGHAASDVRLDLAREPEAVSQAVQQSLQSILLTHLRQHDWGRGAALLGPLSLAGAPG